MSYECQVNYHCAVKIYNFIRIFNNILIYTYIKAIKETLQLQWLLKYKQYW